MIGNAASPDEKRMLADWFKARFVDSKAVAG